MGNKPGTPPTVKEEEISLSRRRLEQIPPNVFTKHNCTGLILDFNQITTIPPEILNLKQLDELSFAANKVSILPPYLEQLSSLSKLNIAKNDILELSPSLLLNLTQLQELHIDDNPLGKLPDLIQLKELRIFSGSQIGLKDFFHLNPNFAFPPKMTRIMLTGNNLTVAPSLVNMNFITQIDLSENNLKEIPQCFTALQSIRRLYLSCNHLEALPVGFGSGWPNLVSLSIAYNNLKTLPEELNELKSLDHLDIRGNKLPLMDDKKIETIQELLCFVNPDKEPLELKADQKKLRIEVSTQRPDLIMPNLYLGCYECARNKSLLQQLNVTHVLTVASFKPLYPDSFVYKVVDIDDVEIADLYSHLDGCMDFIDDAIKSNGNVFIHCRAGVSRSGSVVCAYVMHKQGLPRDEAIEFVRQNRSRVQPNNGFLVQLNKWHTTLSDRRIAPAEPKISLAEEVATSSSEQTSE
eukprot:TRINITY_DN1409_c0_g1_i1.p1 TRINITY_DN1409_c0_g1~~TRINITY_DN1409_c0_g1_i1.p1  ORF type:complete len:472 (-),score=73.03 TRINITY_DN1409_c0_g1_i1:61-1455(-)